MDHQKHNLTCPSGLPQLSHDKSKYILIQRAPETDTFSGSFPNIFWKILSLLEEHCLFKSRGQIAKMQAEKMTE